MNGSSDDAGAEDLQARARRIWLRLAEQERQYGLLEARLARLEASRSWRLTAPLRAIVAWARGLATASPRARPALQPAEASAIELPWPPMFEKAMQRRGASAWLDAPMAGPRYLVDVTELALEDLGAGVQRVTRSWLSELLLAPPCGFVVEPVRLSRDGGYVLARSFLAQFVGLDDGDLGEDAPLKPRSADVFVGLDFCRDRVAQLEPALAPLRGAGVPISLVVPDMLPLQHPQWFPPGISQALEAWLRVLVQYADQAICISRDCADNLRAQLSSRALHDGSLRIVAVPLGSDLPTTLSGVGAGIPGGNTGIRLLVVGTIEPRKQHAQVLDAFDLLLAQEMDVQLLIVGHPGWATEDLMRRIRRHPQVGKRLHWLSHAEDATLAAAYRGSDLLVMASLGEGFGLPIGEAARLGCGLLLRDIAVFHEVAGETARYFSGTTGPELQGAVVAWSQSRDRATLGPPDWHWPTWRESAVLLKNETIPG